MSAPKKETAKKVTAAEKPVKNPIIYHGSVIVHNLPLNIKKVYNHTVRRLLPKTHHARLAKNVSLIEEVGNATMCVEVEGRETAKLLYNQLQNRKVYGRRWKVQYVPLSALECSAEACLLDCLLIPAASQMLAEEALRGIPGFLSFIDTPDEPLPVAAAAAAAAAASSPIQDADNDSVHGDEEGGRTYGGEERHRLLVSFADEGSALHARGVLSGRLVGTTGVRMFLERRNPATSQ